jgi:hypothetical protein
MAENYFQIRLWTLCFRSDLNSTIAVNVDFCGVEYGGRPTFVGAGHHWGNLDQGTK